MAGVSVATPLDPARLRAGGRRDLLTELRRRLLEEAPGAYKDIGPVIDSVRLAGAARPVARLAPLITVKG
jgi:tRNA-splicing ligase RtcB